MSIRRIPEEVEKTVAEMFSKANAFIQSKAAEINSKPFILTSRNFRKIFKQLKEQLDGIFGIPTSDFIDMTFKITKDENVILNVMFKDQGSITELKTRLEKKLIPEQN